MDRERLDQCRRQLLALRRDLAGDVSALREEGLALGTDGTQDMGDDAANTYARQMLLGLSERERAMVREIDEALDRIDEGAYGECEECGEAIGEARLRVVPYATLCVDCKADREGRGPGGRGR